MKKAETKEGFTVRAAESAPSKARCPICGGEVTLRHRRLMNNAGITYFWRHLSNRNRLCSARSRLYA